MGLNPSRMNSATDSDSDSSSDSSSNSSSSSSLPSSNSSASGISPPTSPSSPTHSDSDSSSLHVGEEEERDSSATLISSGSDSEENSTPESLLNYSTFRHSLARRRTSRQISSEEEDSDGDEMMSSQGASRTSARIRSRPAVSRSGTAVPSRVVSPPASTSTSSRGRGVGRPRLVTRRVTAPRVVDTLRTVSLTTATAEAGIAARAAPAIATTSATVTSSSPATATTSTPATATTSTTNALIPATVSTGGSNNTAPRPSPMRANANASFNPSYFECIVCLENLDSPATLIETAAPIAVSQPSSVISILSHVGLVQLPSHIFQGQQQQQPQAPPVPARRSAASLATARKESALAKIDPREICSTACGHLYHKYCIQKWFNEQGRKTCPSCRKACGAKLIRLFPNIGQDVPSRRENHPQPNLNLGGDGGTTTTAAETVGASDSGPGAVGGGERRGVQTGCGNPRCADLVTIHDTLVSDYNELRTAFMNNQDQLRGVQEDLQMRTAEMASVQDLNDELTRENADLKTAANSGAVKRRRRSRND